MIISVYFDRKLHAKVKEKAKREGRSLSNFLRWLGEREVCPKSFNSPDSQPSGFQLAA